MKRDDGKQKDSRRIAEPVDVVNGLPDCASRPAPWKYALLGVLFAGWLAFLVACLIVGRAGAP